MKQKWEEHGCVAFLYYEYTMLRMKIADLSLTILFLSSEDEDDFRSRWGPGDFCNAFTLVSDPGREAGGVADKPAVEPKFQKQYNFIYKKPAYKNVLILGTRIVFKMQYRQTSM